MLLAPNKTAPTLTWAEFWLAQGWAIFPVCSPLMGPHTHGTTQCDESSRDYGKHPLTRNGHKDATPDVDQVRLWWERWPDANIAGTPPPDHFVVDIDGPTDIEFPATWEHATGQGRHLVYRQNPVNVIPHGQKIWPNVDTRCHAKGYVVLPPARHRSGASYELVAQLPVAVFSSGLRPVKAVTTKPGKAVVVRDDVASVLLKTPDDPTAGDDDMIKVAGYLARYVPDRDVFCALLSAVNTRLVVPLDDTAMDKKFTQWDRHREVQAAKQSVALDDEARGWLFERPATDDVSAGYDTPIDGRDGTVVYMPITDFTMRATGIIVAPGFAKRVFIVDCVRADGVTLVGQKIDTDTMCEATRLKKWLARRGLNTYEHRKDPRGGSLGQRLIKMLESQTPVALESRDHYGWCAETSAFLIEQGEVTHAGLRGFTQVYPDDKLRTDAPTAFSFDGDVTQAREWLSRVLSLQPEREAVKIGAWVMMLLLRGHWHGLLPGLLVQASAGTGKTRFFQLLFKLLGSTNEGESLTVPAMRDKLLGSTSNAVWLDDVHLDDRQQQLMRGALTNGKVTLKHQGNDGSWETVEKHMRASIVVSGEGVDWYRQKALRDRFIEVNFDTSIRTVDADKLVTEDIGRASGALLMAVLGTAPLLAELEALREGVTARDEHARTTLRIGARVLDAVLGSGHKWTRILDGWYLNDAEAESQGHASENVLNVLPTLWRRHHFPMAPGQGSLSQPIFYDQVAHCFWIRTEAVADEWNQTQKNLDIRARQMTSVDALQKELKACGSDGPRNKYTARMGGLREGFKYWPLPKRYSDIVVELSSYVVNDTDEEN